MNKYYDHCTYSTYSSFEAVGVSKLEDCWANESCQSHTLIRGLHLLLSQHLFHLSFDSHAGQETTQCPGEERVSVCVSV